jgi:hypothetical protein
LCEIKEGARYRIDLGRVADIAKVVVNNRPVATLWSPPFRADISKHVKVGRNRIAIEVTNTWHNRLVYDADLEADQRKTWTISGPAKDEPLEPAGLVSPIRIEVGQLLPLRLESTRSRLGSEPHPL